MYVAGNPNLTKRAVSGFFVVSRVKLTTEGLWQSVFLNFSSKCYSKAACDSVI